MKRLKIIYIISRVEKSLEFEWLAESIDRSRYDLEFILLGPGSGTPLKQKLDSLGIPAHEILLRGKIDFPKCFFRVRKLLKAMKPDLVNCHLFEATLIGLFAARSLGVKNRIYTRHHATFHHIYAPHAIKYDVWANRNAKRIVAVSSSVKKILTEVEHAPEEKVVVINHGIKTEQFSKVEAHRIVAVKDKYGLANASVIVGSMARYDEWKGVQYTIQAFSKLLEKYPDAKLVLANAGVGDHTDAIRSLLKSIPSGNYVEIRFENDAAALYKCMNVLVHVPVDETSEAFGQVYIEAMASGVPMIATRSGVGLDLIRHLETGWEAEFRSPDSILEGMVYMITHPVETNRVITNAFETVRNSFTFERKLELLTQLFESECR